MNTPTGLVFTAPLWSGTLAEVGCAAGVWSVALAEVGCAAGVWSVNFS